MPGVAFLSSGRKLRPVVGQTDSRFRYAALLRCCTDYAFGFSMLDETGFYAPSVAHNAFPSRPWLRISVLHGHNPTVSKQLRYALSRESVCTPPGGAYGPYVVVVIHLLAACYGSLRLRPLRCGGNSPGRASLVILLGVNSNCPNSGKCIALQQGLKNKQMFAIINEARK